MSRSVGSIARGLLAAATVLVTMPLAAAGEDLPFVDGAHWRGSAAPVKRAYLIGVGNLLNAEYAYQQEKGPPPDGETTIQRFYEGIDDITLDAVVERIDRWYKEHPDQQETTVLEVIWLDMVEPNLPADRRE